LAPEAIYRKHGLPPKNHLKSSQQIERPAKATNQVEQESKEKLELDRPVVTKDCNKEERVDKDIDKDHILHSQEAEEAALEDEDSNEDSVHEADDRYEADAVLRIGMVVARNEEKPELDQTIQDDKKGLAIAEEVIEVLLEEKFVENEPLVYTCN